MMAADERADFRDEEERAAIREESRGNGTAGVALIQHCTDLGNARRFVLHHGSHIRFVSARGGWFIWDDRRFRLDDSGEIERRAKQTVESIWQEIALAGDSKEKDEVARHARRSESASRIEAMIRLAQSEPEVVARPERLDGDPFLFNVLNGTIDLKTGELRPHRQSDLLTELAAVAYDPRAECPTWVAFLERIHRGDKQLIRFIQRAMGYALTGDTREQCLFILHGTGANGKSTLLETLRSTFGDYAQQADFSTFLSMRDDGRPRNDLARLVGARFVAAIEVEGGRRLAEAFVKQLTGQDTITVRYLYKEFFEFRPTFKIFLAANHKPQIKGTDNAIWRRIKLIPFTVTIPPEEQDRDLPAKLREELPGILAWAVRGCIDWQAHGLGDTEAVRTATGAYRDESDLLAAFFAECCVINPNAQASAKALYVAFAKWCEDAGERAESQRAFGSRLAERDGFDRVRREHGVVWLGIGLKHNDGAAS